MIYLLSLLTTIQIWDVHTTSDAKKKGYGREAWKTMLWINRLSEDSAFWALLAIKGALCVGLWYVFLPLQGAIPIAVLIGLILFYIYFVVIGNTRLWYQFHYRR